jgi:hypothetical protein
MTDIADKLLPKWMTDLNLMIGIFAGFLTAFFLSTRLITTIQSSQKQEEAEKGQKPPRLPYWVPFFGSSPSFWLDPSSTLRGAKEQFPQGIFSVKLGRSLKTYVYSSFLSKDLLDPRHEKQTSPAESKLRFLQNGFGLPLRFSQRFLEIWPGLQTSITDMDKDFGKALEAEALKSMERQMPDLISFASSPIDSEQWERVSGTILLDDKETVETGLVALTQTFLTLFTSTQLLSPSLFDATPELVALLLTIPSELDKLLNKPRAASPRAAAVLRTLSTHVQPFLDAVYAKDDDVNAIAMYDDVPDAKTPFLSILRNEELVASPASIQISVLVYLLTLSVIPHVIVPWTLLRLNAPFSSTRKRHAAAVQDAVTHQVLAHQEAGIGAFRPPPVVQVPEKALNSEAFNGALAESILALARGTTEVDLIDDITISPQATGEERSVDAIAPERWHLKAGQTVIAAHWLEDRGLEDAEWSDITDSVGEAVEEALKKRKFCSFQSALSMTNCARYSWRLPSPSTLFIPQDGVYQLHCFVPQAICD